MKNHAAHLESLSQKVLRVTLRLGLAIVLLGALLIAFIFRADLSALWKDTFAENVKKVVIPSGPKATDIDFGQQSSTADQLFYNQKDLFEYKFEGLPNRLTAMQTKLSEAHSSWNLEMTKDAPQTKDADLPFVTLVNSQKLPGIGHKIQHLKMLALLPGEQLQLKPILASGLKPTIRLGMRAIGIAADRQDLPLLFEIQAMELTPVELDPKGAASSVSLQWNAESGLTLKVPKEASGIVLIESADFKNLVQMQSTPQKTNWIIMWNLPSAKGKDSRDFFPKSSAALDKVQGAGRVGRLERLIPETASSSVALGELFESNKVTDGDFYTGLQFWGRWGQQSTAEFQFSKSAASLGQSQVNSTAVTSGYEPNLEQFAKAKADIKLGFFDFKEWEIAPSFKLLAAIPFSHWPSHLRTLGSLAWSKTANKQRIEFEKVTILDEILAKTILTAGLNNRWVILGLKESLPEDTALKPDEPQSFAWISDPNWIQKERAHFRILPLRALNSLFSKTEKWSTQFFEDWFLMLREEQNWALRSDEKGLHFHFPRAYYHIPFYSLKNAYERLLSSPQSPAVPVYAVPFSDWQTVRSKVDAELELAPKTLNLYLESADQSAAPATNLLLNTGRLLSDCAVYPQDMASFKIESSPKKSNYETRIQIAAMNAPVLVRCSQGPKKLSDDFDVIVEQNGEQLSNSAIFLGSEAFPFEKILERQKTNLGTTDRMKWEWMLTSEHPPSKKKIQGNTLHIWTELDPQYRNGVAE